MTEELRQAKEKVRLEVHYAIDSIIEMANDNHYEPAWVLEEFRNQTVAEINKKLKEM